MASYHFTRQGFLRPALSGVQYASGGLPLQEGVLTVAWEADACNNSSITLSSPPETSGLVILPVRDPSASLLINNRFIGKMGTLVKDDSGAQPETTIRIPLGEGDYRLEVQSHCDP